VSWLLLVVALVALQRVAELALARRNTARLMARGAQEFGREHYPLFVALHTAWLVSLVVLLPWDRQPLWPLLAAYLLLQPLRLWVIASLGEHWTTRVIVLPGRPLVRTGPYRYVRHPNYLLVLLEVPLLPLAFGALDLALLFGAANLALIALRIRVEDRALRAAPAAG
jgi:methyltransferase